MYLVSIYFNLAITPLRCMQGGLMMETVWPVISLIYSGQANW